MKAYFSDYNTKLYLCDALVQLNKMQAKSIDLIFADPPYNLSNGGFTCHSGKRVSVNKGEWDKSLGFDTDLLFHLDWIKASKRLLKDTGSLWISGTYHSIYACGFALKKHGFHIINDITWFKTNAPPNLSCRMFTASHETLIWAKKNKIAKHTFNYRDMKEGCFPSDFIKKTNKQMRSVWSIPSPKPKEKLYKRHPTQKPELLLERIILSSTNKGDIVLDPFCGSGTSGVVALRHARKYIGIDNNKEYLDEIATKRLLEELKTVRQSNLEEMLDKKQ